MTPGSRLPEKEEDMRKKGIMTVTVAAVIVFAMTAEASGLEQSSKSIAGGGNDTGLPAVSEEAPSVNTHTVALDDIGISVDVESCTSIRQDEGFVYIYTKDDGSIPYVIIGSYDLDAESFPDAFTRYMADEYADLDTDLIEEGVEINGMTFSRAVYGYRVGGYAVTDTRLFTGLNGRTYMFGTKEVPELGYTVDEGFLEEVAGSFRMLAGGDGDYEFHVDAGRSLEEGFSPDTGDSGQAEAEQTETGNTEPASQAGDGIVFSEDMASYDGIWCPFEDGFRLYLPSSWSTFIVSDEMKANGCLYQAGDETAVTDSTAPYVEVNYLDVSPYGYTTADNIASDLTVSGYTVDETTNVNGIECVMYHMDSPDLSGLMFYGPKDANYVFAVVAHNYAAHEDILAPVLCSLKAY